MIHVTPFARRRPINQQRARGARRDPKLGRWRVRQGWGLDFVFVFHAVHIVCVHRSKRMVSAFSRVIESCYVCLRCDVVDSLIMNMHDGTVN